MGLEHRVWPVGGAGHNSSLSLSIYVRPASLLAVVGRWTAAARRSSFHCSVAACRHLHCELLRTHQRRRSDHVPSFRRDLLILRSHTARLRPQAACWLGQARHGAISCARRDGGRVHCGLCLCSSRSRTPNPRARHGLWRARLLHEKWPFLGRHFSRRLATLGTVVAAAARYADHAASMKGGFACSGFSKESTMVRRSSSSWSPMPPP